MDYKKEAQGWNKSVTARINRALSIKKFLRYLMSTHTSP